MKTSIYQHPRLEPSWASLQTGEGFLLKFELCLGLSWLTWSLVLLVPLSWLVLVLAWLVLGFASASSVLIFVGRRRA